MRDGGSVGARQLPEATLHVALPVVGESLHAFLEGAPLVVCVVDESTFDVRAVDVEDDVWEHDAVRGACSPGCRYVVQQIGPERPGRSSALVERALAHRLVVLPPGASLSTDAAALD